MVVVGHREAKILMADNANLAVPSLVRIRSGLGVAYMADADEFLAWQAASQVNPGTKS
jgi:hypothetical protein